MLGFSAAAMNAYQNGSPSALEGEAEQTRDVPTADLATGLVDKAKALQQSTAWEEKTELHARTLGREGEVVFSGRCPARVSLRGLDGARQVQLVNLHVSVRRRSCVMHFPFGVLVGNGLTESDTVRCLPLTASYRVQRSPSRHGRPPATPPALTDIS